MTEEQYTFLRSIVAPIFKEQTALLYPSYEEDENDPEGDIKSQINTLQRDYLDLADTKKDMPHRLEERFNTIIEKLQKALKRYEDKYLDAKSAGQNIEALKETYLLIKWGLSIQIESLQTLFNLRFSGGEESQKAIEPPQGNEPQKRPAAKWYALLHWVLINIGKEKHFNMDINDKYPKKHIIQFAQNRYGFKNGQGFYNAFINIDITKKSAIAKGFGKGYKDTIIELSGNDNAVIIALKDYPT